MLEGAAGTLTVTQAYEAMFQFLENYYFETGAAEIGVILAELQLIGPAKSADSSAWPSWLKAVATVVAKGETG